VMSAYFQSLPSISLDGNVIEQDGEFVYLRSFVNSEGGSDHKIEKRIWLASASFTQLIKSLRQFQTKASLWNLSSTTRSLEALSYMGVWNVGGQSTKS
jgi:hypothetical protein